VPHDVVLSVPERLTAAASFVRLLRDSAGRNPLIFPNAPTAPLATSAPKGPFYVVS